VPAWMSLVLELGGYSCSESGLGCCDLASRDPRDGVSDSVIAAPQRGQFLRADKSRNPHCAHFIFQENPLGERLPRICRSVSFYETNGCLDSKKTFPV
jgi:hypothetical protein